MVTSFSEADINLKKKDVKWKFWLSMKYGLKNSSTTDITYSQYTFALPPAMVKIYVRSSLIFLLNLFR